MEISAATLSRPYRCSSTRTPTSSQRSGDPAGQSYAPVGTVAPRYSSGLHTCSCDCSLSALAAADTAWLLDTTNRSACAQTRLCRHIYPWHVTLARNDAWSRADDITDLSTCAHKHTACRLRCDSGLPGLFRSLRQLCYFLYVSHYGD